MSAPMMDAVSIADAVRSGKMSAEQITKDFVGRAQTANASLNAFHELFESEALESARAVDAQVKAGKDPGPLAGVPVANVLKQNVAALSLALHRHVR